MCAADERSAKRITRVVHIAPAKRIEFRYRDEETASLARENRLGFSGSRMCPLPLSYRTYRLLEVDAAKEFPHRDESGTAETVCCSIFTVWLHRPLHATSATFFARNISISLAVRECCGTHSRRTNQTKSMRSIRTCCTFWAWRSRAAIAQIN